MKNVTLIGAEIIGQKLGPRDNSFTGMILSDLKASSITSSPNIVVENIALGTDCFSQKDKIDVAVLCNINTASIIMKEDSVCKKPTDQLTSKHIALKESFYNLSPHARTEDAWQQLMTDRNASIVLAWGYSKSVGQREFSSHKNIMHRDFEIVQTGLHCGDDNTSHTFDDISIIIPQKTLHEMIEKKHSFNQSGVIGQKLNEHVEQLYNSTDERLETVTSLMALRPQDIISARDMNIAQLTEIWCPSYLYYGFDDVNSDRLQNSFEEHFIS